MQHCWLFDIRADRLKNIDFSQPTDIHCVVHQGGWFDARVGCFKMMTLASLQSLIMLYHIVGHLMEAQAAFKMMTFSLAPKVITLCSIADPSIQGWTALNMT